MYFTTLLNRAAMLLFAASFIPTGPACADRPSKPTQPGHVVIYEALNGWQGRNRRPVEVPLGTYFHVHRVGSFVAETASRAERGLTLSVDTIRSAEIPAGLTLEVVFRVAGTADEQVQYHFVGPFKANFKDRFASATDRVDEFHVVVTEEIGPERLEVDEAPVEAPSEALPPSGPKVYRGEVPHHGPNVSRVPVAPSHLLNGGTDPEAPIEHPQIQITPSPSN